jgi:hypothetical protein
LIDAGGARTRVYDYAGRGVLDHWTSGPFAGLALSNHLDKVKGRDRLDLLGAPTNLHQAFGYDGYGRLNTVTSLNVSATYTFLPNSDRVQITQFLLLVEDSPMTTTRVWEQGERLHSITHRLPLASQPMLGSRQFWYDPLQRRTQALLEDGSRWQYGYDDRDEVTGGRRFWGDGQAVSGEQFTYAYDAIGNRTNSAAGGDANGANPRVAAYAPNELNGKRTGNARRR